ncbi:hypothetical protein DUNSADRAFT_4508 [Dunaliella salina]|uniref:Encoded protein n=1 Tax=Dunaliella salina TaxID=3046 RepID=A0ABQ7GRY9_DUNSA|nr:hypothetical protein DUNSADRAFT_4508 [Dunaliella salina]|eukprot:KAF5837349.1 hypothetical protein DUNSADRAFT_4508 [Dunaliella salina]
MPVCYSQSQNINKFSATATQHLVVGIKILWRRVQHGVLQQRLLGIAGLLLSI